MGRVGPIGFLRETASELRKSVWPTKEETARLTVIVIVLAVAMGFFLGLLDRAFDFAMSFVIGLRQLPF
ncbi:MAG: preprotein translocase subunit SecE [Chloroflexi bacterium]|nr:preprotein translocase subunit SecE [Chloroflexota bacterium]